MLRQELINVLIKDDNVIIATEAQHLTELKEKGEKLALVNMSADAIYIAHSEATCTEDLALYRLDQYEIKILDIDPSQFDWWGLGADNQLNFLIFDRIF